MHCIFFLAYLLYWGTKTNVGQMKGYAIFKGRFQESKPCRTPLISHFMTQHTIVTLTVSLTFLGYLVLTVFIRAGSPRAPRRYLTIHRTAYVAELGGVWRNTQTKLTVHWPQCYRDTDKVKDSVNLSLRQV